MSDAVDIDVRGLTQVVRAFNELPDRSRRHVIRPAVTKGGRKVSTAMKRNVKQTRKAAHRDSDSGRKTAGLAEKSIGVKTVTYTATQVVMAIIGMRRDPQFHGRANLAHLIEEGWRIARGGTLTRSSGKGKRAKGVTVGRVPGRHVAANAFRSTQATVQSTLEREVAAGVEKEAAKLNRAS